MRTIAQIVSKTDYNENQVELLLAECFSDYAYFAEHVLGFDVAEYHEEWFEMLEKWDRLCVVAFRGSGKTNWICGYYIWKALFHSSKLNFLIVSGTFEQAKIVLKLIRDMFKDNEILSSFIPTSKEATWRATELETRSGATFYCRTYSENIRGLRIDYALCDEAGQYEDKSLFWNAISPVVQLNRGKICVIGTKESEADLLSELSKNDEYMYKEYPAEQNGKVLWKQKYTLAPEDTLTQRSLVKVRKEIGELNYMQEYLLIPKSSANSLFPYELTLKGVMDDETFLPYGRKDEKYYIGYDMAISLQGDYTVMTVLGVTAERKRIAKIVRFRDSFEQQLRVLKKLVDDFRPVKILVDGTGMGEKQSRDVQMELNNVEIAKISYDYKYKLLMDLRQEFDRLNIIIPNSKVDSTYEYSQILLKELNDFGLKIDLRPGETTRPKFNSGRHDDCVMSLALANKASQVLTGNLSFRFT